MIQFMTTTNQVVSLDPHQVSSILECGLILPPLSLLSGGPQQVNVLEITMTNGTRWKVLDPQRTVERQIQEARRK